ncbi:uridylyl transferase [Stigmatella aurantiaca DW4/3-1]|uniref:Uridylyl transferase n=1 Tax=Stigmatella aurantiaca (strain DW4/3-1) TaxID=378806 RepID=Q094P0_STIAD|nr:uridylyl transferase [Stigmatella aurantiaca DW4/3-1]
MLLHEPSQQRPVVHPGTLQRAHGHHRVEAPQPRRKRIQVRLHERMARVREGLTRLGERTGAVVHSDETNLLRSCHPLERGQFVPPVDPQIQHPSARRQPQPFERLQPGQQEARVLELPHPREGGRGAIALLGRRRALTVPTARVPWRLGPQRLEREHHVRVAQPARCAQPAGQPFGQVTPAPQRPVHQPAPRPHPLPWIVSPAQVRIRHLDGHRPRRQRRLQVAHHEHQGFRVEASWAVSGNRGARHAPHPIQKSGPRRSGTSRGQCPPRAPGKAGQILRGPKVPVQSARRPGPVLKGADGSELFHHEGISPPREGPLPQHLQRLLQHAAHLGLTCLECSELPIRFQVCHGQHGRPRGKLREERPHVRHPHPHAGGRQGRQPGLALQERQALGVGEQLAFLEVLLGRQPRRNHHAQPEAAQAGKAFAQLLDQLLRLREVAACDGHLDPQCVTRLTSGQPLPPLARQQLQRPHGPFEGTLPASDRIMGARPGAIHAHAHTRHRARQPLREGHVHGPPAGVQVHRDARAAQALDRLLPPGCEEGLASAQLHVPGIHPDDLLGDPQHVLAPRHRGTPPGLRVAMGAAQGTRIRHVPDDHLDLRGHSSPPTAQTVRHALLLAQRMR